jgi:hypothetical protein
MSGEYLSMAEIEAKYPNEWVLIDRPKVDRYERTTAGWLLFHSADKEEVFRRAMEIPSPRSVAFLFIGGPRLAEDEAFAL